MVNRETQSAKASATPLFRQQGKEIQAFGTVIPMPIGLDENVRKEQVKALNQILADSATLRDMYKKHHWQVSGPTFNQLHLLFDKHFGEQVVIVDELAERIQAMGGISVAMAHDIAEMTQIERPPMGREDVPTQLSRLMAAHEQIIISARAAAKRSAELGDDGTNDLLVSSIVRTNEMQVWFLAEHLAPVPLTRDDS